MRESVTAGEGEFIAFQDDREAPGERYPRFLEPRRLAIFIAKVFNAKVCRERVRIELAAS